ncbi:27 kDa hemolymph glycoprotein-like [Portunus trituberculatus]|uniref:Hemolymph glycoprotein n=1 Tax=Portunus trituberculatus TaxID=210409 RepID=A0A5B7CUX8_PORTR|nr:27 kDa hemolymph glycoprotein-like [Portunus trituberculatus]MPC12136.1 hemolymph glycoprotein [Portunus trituberculatus]
MGYHLLACLVVVMVVLGNVGVVPVVGQKGDPQNLPFNNATKTQVSEWLDRCNATAGEGAVKDIKNSVGELMECVQKHINFNKLEEEVNASIARGELDVVFKKYCKRRSRLMACAEDMFTKVERCADEKQKQDLNITRRVIHAGIDFVCHNDGDRIALFMAEKGQECLKNHSKNIEECIEEKVPRIKDYKNNSDGVDITTFTIDEENCKNLQGVQECVVKHTSKCDDETPANILGSLMTQMLKVTPCSQANGASTLLSHTQHLLPHLLTLLAAALTAANLLL